MGGNFKIKKQAPIDDRSTVAKKIDLQNPNLFDGFTYNGMIVSVVDDTINNGLYRLEDKSTKTWVKESGSGSGGAGLSSEDRIKLDGIAVEATKNLPDDELKDRTKHVGNIPMSVVSGLSAALASASVGGMSTAETTWVTNIEKEVNKKVGLDVSGKISSNLLPDIASGRKIKVLNKAERLSLNVHSDITIAYQADDGISYAINANENPAIDANWSPMGNTVISGMASFNGRAGNVFPTVGDYDANMITETRNKVFVNPDSIISWDSKVNEAPNDGNIYVRRNKDWIVSPDSETILPNNLTALYRAGLLFRENHTGTQDIETINGLRNTLNNKADIDTVYAQPMATDYTIREAVVGEQNSEYVYLLNSNNTSMNSHAYAMVSTHEEGRKYTLNTKLLPSGFSEERLPEKEGVILYSSEISPNKPMTGFTEGGQVVSATSQYSTGYEVWRAFQGFPVANGNYTDCWATNAVPTVATPQIATIVLEKMAIVTEYRLQNRFYPTPNSPRDWTFEGRPDSTSQWIILDTVVGNTENASAEWKIKSIEKSKQIPLKEFRWVFTARNGNDPYMVISRIKMQSKPASYLIRDGKKYYKPSTSSQELLYTPMTNASQVTGKATASSEYAGYPLWNLFKDGLPTTVNDGWLSAALPTESLPQLVEFDFGVPKTIAYYQLVLRFPGTLDPSPKKWALLGRNNTSEKWNYLHSVDDNPLHGNSTVLKYKILPELEKTYRYVRLSITDRNNTGNYVMLSRLMFYSDISYTPLIPVNLTNVGDIATLGQSSSSRISPTDMEQLNEPYLVTSTPHIIELVYDPIEILTIVNDVDISFFKNKIRFRPKKLGVYRFCYQEVIA